MRPWKLPIAEEWGRGVIGQEMHNSLEERIERERNLDIRMRAVVWGQDD